MLRILVILLFFVPAQLLSQGQTRTRKQVTKQYYLNGNLKSITAVSTTLPRYIDPMNFYKKTKVEVTEFDSLSKSMTRQFTRITKIGKDGKPCYEIFYEETIYDKFGNKKTYLRSRCDKQRSKFIQYKEGRVEFIQIHKRRKRK
ncbi:MAG: hypothetical protein L6Q81_07880 [Bacteroidia bacterium]|nr:hypothetical protein [Bacteroidia bacterium]